MALVIISSKGNGLEWKSQLKQLDSELDIRIYPDERNRDEVTFALAWNPPLGIFSKFPSLKCISSTGAGVDHILKDAGLPTGVSVTRVVDERLSQDMSNYLITYVMAHLRSTEVYNKQQQNRNWQQLEYQLPENVGVGILGMGELGSNVAKSLIDLGFEVKGWSRSAKVFDSVSMYTGNEELESFLSDVNILICLLPLTDETRNILSGELFKTLPKGAYIINVARGEHLVDADLLEYINNGHLSGACLDVFRKEPLPKDHPFWLNDKITITPHVASVTSIADVAPQILENYRRTMAGEPLLNLVSMEKGY